LLSQEAFFTTRNQLTTNLFEIEALAKGGHHPHVARGSL
jgi:hypothetical protein